MIDAIVSAVKQRQSSAIEIASKINASIVYDDRGINGGGDAWYNTKRVLRSCKQECSHILYLQDDIDFCDNFSEYAQKCVEFMPDAIWSFFVGVKAEPYVIKADNTSTPFVRVRGCKTSGQAIIFPKKFVEPLITETEFYFGDEHIYKRDDSRIGMWCAFNGVPLMTTNPQLVQHLGIKSTLANHNRNGNNYSRSFVKDVPALNLNFNAKSYNETKLVSPHLWHQGARGIKYFEDGVRKEKERI